MERGRVAHHRGCWRAGEKMIYTPNMAAGCAMAITGFCLYSHCKLRASQSKAKPNPFPPFAPLQH